MKDYSYELLDLLEKYKGDAEAALRGETSPWCLYAFSPLRENLFEWLEIGKKDRVLQVGSDYGSCIRDRREGKSLPGPRRTSKGGNRVSWMERVQGKRACGRRT